jgi:selenide,water dikinase
VDAHAIVRNSTAKPGDVLVLTKPIGTGIISTAIKRAAADAQTVEAAVACMTTLNRGASEAVRRVGVHAATDVTGFGLLGHLRSMLRASGVAARISAGAVPLLPDARSLAATGNIPGGSRRNRTDVEADVRWSEGIDEVTRVLLCDAQTSGGLLVAVPAARADAFVAELGAQGTPAAARLGEVVEGAAGTIEVFA